MKLFFPLFTLFIIFSISACSQQKTKINALDISNDRPSIVIGIVVDQMRYDYLTRYWDDYGDDGFKRLINEGFLCRNHHFGYAPTYTGPGHASIYTGTTPAQHGIIANDWYDRDEKKIVYCASDSTVKGVGTTSVYAQMSPKRMIANSIADELKLHSNQQSKVIGISLKDRGAILPAGHSGNAAYWYMGGQEGVWATSTHYMDTLPTWVQEFNKAKISDEYMDQPWELLRDVETYNESHPDVTSYEMPFTGKPSPAFPFDLRALEAQNDFYSLLKQVPAGNSMTVDFALAAIAGEALGKDEYTDLLAISFSATDYVGHRFGIDAMETQDCYLRLDQDIARFLRELDAELGANNYAVFLTADHGGATVPSFAKTLKIPADYWSYGDLLDEATLALNNEFGEQAWILNYSNDQFFLNLTLMDSLDVDIDLASRMIRNIAMKQDGVVDVIFAEELLELDRTDRPWSLIDLGQHPKRSGEITILTKPGWIFYGLQGTTHGSPYNYDTHVPFILYGKNIPMGSTVERTYIRDIAPTISTYLGIPFPNACTGDPIAPIFEAINHD